MTMIRQFMGAAVVVFVALAATACSADNKVVLHTSQGDFTFNVELATTSDERARGLMFRTELAEDAGMLFDFIEERPVSFWMQNTLIPLDMIFIAADGEIRSIHENARPLDTTSIPSQFPVRFVFEIPGGRSAEIGLQPGDTMDHPLVVD